MLSFLRQGHTEYHTEHRTEYHTSHLILHLIPHLIPPPTSAPNDALDDAPNDALNKRCIDMLRNAAPMPLLSRSPNRLSLSTFPPSLPRGNRSDINENEDLTAGRSEGQPRNTAGGAGRCVVSPFCKRCGMLNPTAPGQTLAEQGTQRLAARIRRSCPFWRHALVPFLATGAAVADRRYVAC